MKRLTSAPNLALATLWCEQLRSEGFPVTVQRAHACAIVGHIPPDQALPEIWIEHDEQSAAALQTLQALRQAPDRRWRCTGCDELVEGPFEQCWNCGAMAPSIP